MRPEHRPSDFDGDDERVRVMVEERARLEKRLELQMLVHDFSSRMRSERDVEAICRILTDAVSTLTSFRNAFILILDEDGETLRGLHITGHRRTIEIGTRLARFSFPKIRIALREHPGYTRALSDGEVIYHRTREDIVATLATLSGLNPGILEVIRRTTRMNLGITVPLYVGDKRSGITPLGIMGISSTHTEVDAEEMGVVATLATQASLALLNVKLFERLRGQIRRAESSEARIRRLIDNAHDMICVFGTDGRISYANRTFYESAVGSREEFFDHATIERMHPLDQPRAVQMLLDLYAGTPAQGFEYRIRGDNGRYLFHNLNGVPIAMEGTEPNEVVCFIRDMTVEKRREEQVIRRNIELEILNALITNLSSTLNLNEVINSSLSMIADLTGAEALALFVTDEFDPGRLRMLGQLWFPKEIAERLDMFPSALAERGLPWKDRVAVLDDVAALPAELADVSVKGRFTCALTVPVNAKGAFTGFVLAASRSQLVVDDEHVAVLRAVGEQIGIALETSRLFAEVERNSVELERRRREAELYVDLMGHDLSNLIQAAMTSLELLEASGGLDGDGPGLVGSSLTQLRASSALIDRVKTLSSIDRSPAAASELESVDLGEHLRAAVELARAAATGREVRLSLECEGEAWTDADELLDQLLQNLLGNAVKHCRGDPLCIDAAVRPARMGDEEAWLLVVADDGPGVPDDRKGLLFDRPDEKGPRGRTSGLGLRLVRAIVQRYGGRVWVEDRVPGDPSKGAAFKVLLRRAPPPTDAKRSA